MRHREEILRPVKTTNESGGGAEPRGHNIIVIRLETRLRKDVLDRRRACDGDRKAHSPQRRVYRADTGRREKKRDGIEDGKKYSIFLQRRRLID